MLSSTDSTPLNWLRSPYAHVRKPAVQPRLIDARSRVALPARILRELGVQAGDYVAFEVMHDQVFLRKLHITIAPPRP